MSKLPPKISCFVLGLLLPALALFPAQADDTEVLFSTGTIPNVLFILDSSGSMGYIDSGNDSSRMRQMQDAMIELIDSSENINVGLMQFSGSSSSVIYPFANIDSTVPAHTINGVARIISDYTDDSVEYSNGYMQSLSANSISSNNDNIIGLRFTDITIPKGHSITSAYLQLKAKESKTHNAKATITGQNAGNTSTFERVYYNISSRSSTSQSVEWTFGNWSKNSWYNSPDITSIISAITSHADWESGNSLVLKLTNTQGNRTAYSKKDEYPAMLVIETAPITIEEQTAGNAMISVIDKIHARGGTPTVNALYEGVRYLTGSTVDIGLSRGNNQYARVSHANSYINNSVATPANCLSYHPNGYNCRNETISTSGTAPTYISPISQTCDADNNYVILLTDGYPSSSAPEQTAIETLTGGTCSGSNGKQCGTTLAQFIRTGDLRPDLATTVDSGKLYTIGFNHADTWLESLASADNGGGDYYTASSTDGLLSAFNTIISSILDVNTSFSSAGISVSSFNRLNHDNELYFSLFKPSKQVQWDGNLKRYELNGSGKVVDSTGAVAVDDATGLFEANSISFWSTIADGDEVKDGGVASKFEGALRKVYTNLGNGLLSDTSNHVVTTNSLLTNTMLGLSSAASSDDLNKVINFLRGLDDDNDVSYQMYDPLHSVPFSVSYNNTSTTTEENVVFVGDNQGLLHAIDTSNGEELWAFIPQELLENQKTLYDNGEHSTLGHIYGLDGDITGALIDDKKYLYVGMRRGGRSYYALDITDKNAPRLVWKISSGLDDFTELGQSWSKPIKTKITIGSNTKDVLIFAGGYDKAQDTKLVRSNDTMGRAIYIVDAATGARLWWGSGSAIQDGSGNLATETMAKMNYSFASDIKVIDVDNDQLADQMYIGDLGGQLWRFDITNGNSASNLIKGDVIADLNDDTAATNRRFYHAPDVSMFDESTLAIAIGTGFHASPLSTTIEDNFYLIKTPLTAPTTHSDLLHNPLNLMDITSSDTNGTFTAIDRTVLATKNGWYLDLSSNLGEKVLSSSTTANQEIWFTTFEPDPQTVDCVVTPGISRLYRINYYDGSPVEEGAVDGQSCSDHGVSCSVTDRYANLKTASLPADPIIVKVNGNKLVVVGKEVTKYDTVDTTTMFWTDKE